MPGDVSLVSFNDTPLSQLMTPPLTSVSTHADEMARTAVGLLGERCSSVAGRPVRTLPQKVVVPPPWPSARAPQPLFQGKFCPLLCFSAQLGRLFLCGTLNLRKGQILQLNF